MVKWQLLTRAVALIGLLFLLRVPPVGAKGAGCQGELAGKTGAQVEGQVFQPDGGGLVALGERTAEVFPRSGQILRVYVRPLEGPAQPAGPGCPVRVTTGRLNGVARLLTNEGFVFERGVVYGQFRPGEERVLDFEMKPFEEWASPTEQIELENLVITLPETSELVARLPVPPQSPAGTVCADVIYVDAQPVAGVMLSLAVPPDGPANRRATGADGRVCWEGFGETLFGDLSLDPSIEPALGQPRSRYVSREASYRLFVVKRPK
jgi:hypothetical protein